MYRGGDDDDDRPRKSWRERDRQRDRSRHTSSGERSDRGREAYERSHAYRQYKANLDKFFEGGIGAAPDGLKGILDPSGKKSARTKAIEKIQEASAEDRRKWSELVKAFVEEHELPPDPYLLTEFLGHPSEKVAAKALAKLHELVAEESLKKIPPSLDQQLRYLEANADDEELQEQAGKLREILRA